MLEHDLAEGKKTILVCVSHVVKHRPNSIKLTEMIPFITKPVKGGLAL